MMQPENRFIVYGLSEELKQDAKQLVAAAYKKGRDAWVQYSENMGFCPNDIKEGDPPSDAILRRTVNLDPQNMNKLANYTEILTHAAVLIARFDGFNNGFLHQQRAKDVLDALINFQTHDSVTVQGYEAFVAKYKPELQAALQNLEKASKNELSSWVNDETGRLAQSKQYAPSAR